VASMPPKPLGYDAAPRRTLPSVPTLADLVRDRTALSVADAEWLHLLVGDWQLLSDLSFADLVLWLPEDDGSAWVAGAHVRPVTGPMVFFEDQVGIRVERGR